MDVDELDCFFAKQDLSDDERETIEKAKDKVEEYRRIVFFKEYRDAHEKFREFDMALNVKGIFIDDGLAATFKEIADEMWGVMSKHRLSFMREVRGHAIDEKHFEEVDNFHSTGRAKLDAVGVKVKASLRAANHV
jgi:hypothetical protein